MISVYIIKDISEWLTHRNGGSIQIGIMAQFDRTGGSICSGIFTRLFLEKGYNATGINEILAKAEVPKGSFYFHFKSKKEVSEHVAQYYSLRMIEWIEKTAEGRNWKDFISLLVEDMKKMALKGRHHGCPLGVLGIEIAFTEPDLAKKYAESMEKIMVIFSEVLKRSDVPIEQVQDVSRRAFILYQGYLQYYRMTKNIELFDKLQNDVGNII